MVFFRPTVRSTRRLGWPREVWFVKVYKQEAGGQYARHTDGTWDWYPTVPTAVDPDPPPADATIFQVGREYELSEAWATEAYNAGVHGLDPDWSP